MCCGTIDVKPCVSPQHLKVGETGVVQCSFSDFFGIFWYNTTNYVNSYSILDLKGSSKSGSGFLSGEYDIYLNGSLIISNVSWKHDRLFTVLKFDSPADKPVPQYVQVIVIAVPQPAYPVIENCTSSYGLCIKEADYQFDLICSVNYARPAVNVRWVERMHHGDENTTYQTSLRHENKLSTTISTLSVILNSTNILALFVCQVECPLAIFEHTDSKVLLQHEIKDTLLEPPVRIYTRIHTRLTLACSEKHIVIQVWKHSKSLNSRFNTFAYGVFFDGEFEDQSLKDIELEETGILIIPEFQMQHEGFYRCLFSDGISDEVTTFDVLAIVDPVPAYLVVEGCNKEGDCELTADIEGTLKCSLSGIRPLVQLEWREAYKSSSSLVIFEEKKMTVFNRGDKFDVSLTTTYRIGRFSPEKHIIQCAVSGQYGDVFDLKRNVSLTLAISIATATNSQVELIERDTAETDATFNRNLIWLFVLLAPFGLFVYLCFVQKAKRKENWKVKFMKMRRITTEDVEEGNEVEDEENERLGNPRRQLEESLEARKDIFVHQLKEYYANLYNSIRPIPYIQDHMLCVDNVFVESGIQYANFQRGFHSSTSWKKLKTYTNMLPREPFQSTRRVLEADPGYGKSTTMLQIAYDWCHVKTETDFLHDKILILLRLRQLKGVPSIYKAIRKFILPIDSVLNQKDIEEILNQYNSSLVYLLDGYDEYPLKDSRMKTDIMHILMARMFQQSTVILTTRNFCLPKQIDPRSVRMRMTGFDNEARAKYLRKAVVGNDDNAFRRIMHFLKENPIMYDLSQIPLLFVLMAHITHERKVDSSFSSVTTLFRYIITCFHSHMEQKLQDENVEITSSYETQKKHYDTILARIAFDGISGSKQNIVWKMDELCQNFGHHFIDFCLRIGFFVRESMSVDNVDAEIRFYHKLFCEWYAARFIAEDPSKSTDVRNIFRKLDPTNLQFVYRFLCGLRPDLASDIIKYLKEEYPDVAILCFFELSTDAKDFEKTLKKLCSSFITIKNEDSRLLQRAKVHLLESASNKEKTIGSVFLQDCFQRVDQTTCSIVLKSDLTLPTLKHFSNIEFIESGRTLTLEEFYGVLNFGMGCKGLKRIKFSYCVLPFHLDAKSLNSTSNFTVTWNSYDLIQCKLDFNTSSWQLVRKGVRREQKVLPLTSEMYTKIVNLTKRKQEDQTETSQ